MLELADKTLKQLFGWYSVCLKSRDMGDIIKNAIKLLEIKQCEMKNTLNEIYGKLEISE